ncbi:MAG: AbrB/MazE/SpoVT family DNA-binding domain-containing protein [Geodermatophilaceae bacterium]
MEATSAKVTRNGQVSLPAELRHRWRAASVLVIDRGDYAIVRPVPADPLAALRGAHAGPGPTLNDARAAERDAEQLGQRAS